MRHRLAILSCALLAAAVALAPVRVALAGEPAVLAQEVGEGQGESGDVGDSEAEEIGGESGERGQDPGLESERGAEAETGASEDQQAEEGADETGPPWTYQMARLALVLLLLLGLAVGAAYYRFVVMRQRGLV